MTCNGETGKWEWENEQNTCPIIYAKYHEVSWENWSITKYQKVSTNILKVSKYHKVSWSLTKYHEVLKVSKSIAKSHEVSQSIMKFQSLKEYHEVSQACQKNRSLMRLSNSRSFCCRVTESVKVNSHVKTLELTKVFTWPLSTIKKNLSEKPENHCNVWQCI